MSFEKKQRIFAGVLIAMVLWLPVHRFLAVEYHANPWKFAGWAMYALPQPAVRIEFFAAEPGGLRPLAVNQTAPPLREPVVEFLTRRKHAGTLVRPDGLAAPVFELHPEVEVLAVVVTHVVLDPATAREIPQRFGYRYQRWDRQNSGTGEGPEAPATSDLCRLEPRRDLSMEVETRFGKPYGGALPVTHWRSSGKPAAGV